MVRVARPAGRRDFEIAIICALTAEADAVEALFDRYWDEEGPPYDKASGDPNAYSTGYISRHNVVLTHMPSMGKANAAAVTANCRASFPNIKLALVVGVCGAAPFVPGNKDEIVLGDVIISDGVVQYDLGRRLPTGFVRKDTLLDSLGRPSTEIRALLAKLKGVHGKKTLRRKMAGNLDELEEDPELKAEYPGVRCDRLFESKYRHARDGMTCEECGCSGELIVRRRLEQGIPQPAVHFGLIASGDTVMKDGEERDAIAQRENVLGFEMEGAGVWDSFPCVVIKGACDYADSHKTKAWQNYAAATAAACAKAFLDYWVPSVTYIVVPFPKNDAFVGRGSILKELQQRAGKSQAQIALFGLGGIGKTQIALAHVYWLQETRPEVSVFWVYASNAERFRQSFNTIAQECKIPGYDDSKTDVLLLVKRWLEKKDYGRWLMVIDNADDMELFFNPSGQTTSTSSNGNFARYLPECNHGAILVTTRNKKAAVSFAKGQSLIKVDCMEDDESEGLLRATLEGVSSTPAELSELSSRLEHLPLALVQAAAFIQANSISMEAYLGLLDESDHNIVDLLCKEFATIGRDSKAAQAVAQTWMLSFRQIKEQDALAGNLLSLMSMFDRQGIPTPFPLHYSAQERNGGPKSNIELTESVGLLKAFSLISEEKNGSLDMHRLVQLVTRKWLDNDGKISEFGREALLTVSQIYPSWRFENRTIYSAYLPHASAVLEIEVGGLGDDVKAKASLLHCVASYLNFEGK
ncbi:Nucleoside phosphorylase domain protein [Ophiocordyceps sinensis CO18]|uniref:Nucleoside phosphorylase domain protein n=1 Tax=Ophiocordyceps sinensis (strain Co18 / CGMCC 3.14243) TaxID=911162 RepID=T5AQZ8_OPHSC|nr:Nucleoside phosphorylase domain protein [Ophiocordyceps sinensis CO18]